MFVTIAFIVENGYERAMRVSWSTFRAECEVFGENDGCVPRRNKTLLLMGDFQQHQGISLQLTVLRSRFQRLRRDFKGLSELYKGRCSSFC